MTTQHEWNNKNLRRAQRLLKYADFNIDSHSIRAHSNLMDSSNGDYLWALQFCLENALVRCSFNLELTALGGGNNFVFINFKAQPDTIIGNSDEDDEGYGLTENQAEDITTAIGDILSQDKIITVKSKTVAIKLKKT